MLPLCQWGGAIASETPPTRTSTFQFRALRSGIYLYHCGSQPVDIHLAKGMYGLVLVEPKEGLPKVDREFYIMQSEFYTKGEFGDPGLQPFSMQKPLMNVRNTSSSTVKSVQLWTEMP